jgi:hypothetical protein
MGAFGGFSAHYRNKLLHKKTQGIDTSADQGARQESGGLRCVPQGKWNGEPGVAGKKQLFS